MKTPESLQLYHGDHPTLHGELGSDIGLPNKIGLLRWVGEGLLVGSVLHILFNPYNWVKQVLKSVPWLQILPSTLHCPPPHGGMEFQRASAHFQTPPPAPTLPSCNNGEAPWSLLFPVVHCRGARQFVGIRDESLCLIFKIRSKQNNIWKISLEVWDSKMKRFPIFRMKYISNFGIF